MSACTRCDKNKLIGTTSDEIENKPVDLDDCYNLLMSLVPIAGELAMEGFNKINKGTSSKTADWDLVTIYDRSIENLFIESIRKFYLDHKFLGEESADELILTDAPTWIIDPIDGTTNFVHGFPMFAIAVAFSYKKELQFGVTFNPALNQLYTARKGQGAFLNGEPILCSSTKELSKALCLIDPLFQIEGPIRNKCFKRLHKIGVSCRGVRVLGCAAMQLAYVASGKYDLYLVEDLKPWDLAAGAILVKEAGGLVSNCDGSPYNIIDGSIAVGGTSEICQSGIAAFEAADSAVLTVE